MEQQQKKMLLHENEKRIHNWEKMFAKDTSDKGLLRKTYKNSYSAIENEPRKNQPKALCRHLAEKDTQSENKHMNRGSMSYIVRQTQIKPMRKARPLSEWRKPQVGTTLKVGRIGITKLSFWAERHFEGCSEHYFLSYPVSQQPCSLLFTRSG